MLLRILKSNQSVNYFLVVIFAFITWAKSIFHPGMYSFYLGENKNFLFYPLFNLVDAQPEISTGISILLLIIIALLILYINGRYTFIRIRTMLPGSLYILMTGGLVQLHAFHPVYFATLFLLMGIHRLFDVFNHTKPYSAIFDSGFWLGVGALFYLNLIVILPAFVLGLRILSRETGWRIYVLVLTGFFLPLFFAFSYAFLSEQTLEMLKVFEQSFLTRNNHFQNSIPLWIYTGFLLILTIAGSISMIRQYDSKKVSSRKYFTIFFLIFLFSVAGVVLIPAVSQEMLVIIMVPVSYLFSNYLVFMKSKFWSELILILIAGMIIYMQIGT